MSTTTTRTTSTTRTTRTQELAELFELQEMVLENLLSAIADDARLAYTEGHAEWQNYDLKGYRSQLGALLGAARYFKADYDLKVRKESGEY
jgi:hypothetical protein